VLDLRIRDEVVFGGRAGTRNGQAQASQEKAAEC
jgi:hypothetical protein